MGKAAVGAKSEGRISSWEQSSHLLETHPQALAAHGAGSHPSPHSRKRAEARGRGRGIAFLLGYYTFWLGFPGW